jgi:hypothetical protein
MHSRKLYAWTRLSAPPTGSADRALKLMQGGAIPHAGERFAVLRRALASPGIGHAGLRHEVALVARVDEHLSSERGAVFGDQAVDRGSRLQDPAPLAQAAADDRDGVFLHELVEDRLRDVGLEMPLDRAPVFLPDALEELQGVAADHRLLAVIGPAEPARHHSAEMLVGGDERDAQTFSGRRHGGNDTAGRAAIDDDVGRGCRALPGRRGWRRGEDDRRDEDHRGNRSHRDDHAV